MLNFCPYCGTKIVDKDVRFCMSCGKSLEQFMKTQSAREDKFSEPVDEGVLQDELQKCRESAEEGYKLASGKYDEIKNTLIEEARRLTSADSEQSQVSRIQNTELINRQKDELRQLTADVSDIHDNIQLLRERQKDFSIIVYGRTMAGKSTLMEILTRGNGESIGKGAQRTTLDVREYYWQGLKITDVPGICAFGGAEDERLAMEAAKSADLILFLITNDAPQADEAACLAQLKSLGKPVLGIINVKMAFNMARKNLALRNLQKKLAETDVIDSIVEQFKSFDKRHNQNWSDIPFVSTHLLAAYQSRRDNDAEVYNASNFAQVETFILDKVRNDGRFLRIKTFVDSVAVSMNNIIMKIYEHSAMALTESNIWDDKRQQLSEWRAGFEKRAEQKFSDLYNELSEQLNGEITSFTNNHYEDENAGQKWEQRIKSLGFDKRYQDLLKSLADECERKRQELSDELQQEIQFTFSGNTRAKVTGTDTHAWGQYAVAALGGIGGLGGFIAARAFGVAFPPIGIALGVISVIGWLFADSKAEKIRKAKAKMRDGLTNPSFKMLKEIHKQANDIFNAEIMKKGVNEFYELLSNYQFMLARLGESQSKLASTLCNEFRELNAVLLDEAIAYRRAGSYTNGKMTLRVPGKKFALLAERAHLDAEAISSLLGEQFIFMKSHEQFYNNLEMVLDSEFKNDSYLLDSTLKKFYSIVPTGKVNDTNLNLAQQMTECPIMVR